jgi:hypothetical protein
MPAAVAGAASLFLIFVGLPGADQRGTLNIALSTKRPTAPLTAPAIVR